MSLWDKLPTEVEQIIMHKKLQIEYADVMAEFRLICNSLDARVKAHNNTNGFKNHLRFEHTTVFGHSEILKRYGNTSHHSFLIENDWRPGYWHRRGNDHNTYEVQNFTYTNTFGCKNIDENLKRKYDQNISEFDHSDPIRVLHEYNNELLNVPLIKVLQRLRTRQITIPMLTLFLKANNVKVLARYNKGVLVRKWLAL